jgi:hypothetical protein
MLTKTKVIANRAEFKSLINAVISNIGMDSVKDVNNHGIDGGFNGFIYYTDTVPFAYKHRKAILQLLDEDADSLGQEVVEMVSGFGAFRRIGMDADDKKDLYRYLSGTKCKEVTIPNLMAWYAAETVCRWFED